MRNLNEQIHAINGLHVLASRQGEAIVLDCEVPADQPSNSANRALPPHHSGPRIWLERTESNDGWRVFVHAGDNGDPEGEPLVSVTLLDNGTHTIS